MPGPGAPSESPTWAAGTEALEQHWPLPGSALSGTRLEAEGSGLKLALGCGIPAAWAGN